jgi:predicted RNA-binding protein associated with RNAse of E/G family
MFDIKKLKKKKTKKTRGVAHCGIAIYMKKKNYRNSNISPCKNITFKKSSKRNQNPSRYYNSITNLKFQHKPKYHLSKTLI